MTRLAQVTDELSETVRSLSFAAPVTHVYNPLDYAREPHLQYLERYGEAPKEVLLVGMNPGPWGMAQTGVPFGEVSLVRSWLGIDGPVSQPRTEHPKRPIQGFDCSRSEVSGRRLWGWARDRFGTPERFFRRFFVWNYCPLVFMEESGRNRTPDRLAKAEREPLFEACDRALRRAVQILAPEWIVGIGKFAERRARALPVGEGGRAGEPVIGTILHPSPASPKANRGWSTQAEAQLRKLGIDLPRPVP